MTMVDALTYHEQTKYLPPPDEEIATLEEIKESVRKVDPTVRPRPYKLYVDLPKVTLKTIRPPTIPALSAISDDLHPTDQPGFHDDDQHCHNPSSQLDLTELATLCYESGGIIRSTASVHSENAKYRAAAGTGKAYQIDLYAVTDDLGNLESGVYHFDPHDFTLDVVRSGDYRACTARALGASANSDSDSDLSESASAPIYVIATATWWRNAQKYGDRSYRHAFWDTGTIFANLLATATAIDQPCQVYVSFAEGPLLDLLGIDPEWEAPTAIVAIGSSEPPPERRSIAPIDPETVPPSDEPGSIDLIYEAWAASALEDVDQVNEWRQDCQSAVGTGLTDPGDGDRVALDPVDVSIQSKRPLWRTIRRRRSGREFDSEGPTGRQLATVLDRAVGGISADWARWSENGHTGLSFNDCYLFVTGMEDGDNGIPDGIYQYHSDQLELEWLGETDVTEKSRLAVNQATGGNAHVNVYLMTDVHALVDAIGNRGYRVAQLEAGIVLGRLYLATYAHRNLCGTGLTFADDRVTAALSPRAGQQTPTCMFAFGTVPRE